MSMKALLIVIPITLFFAWQLQPLLHARRMRGKTAPKPENLPEAPDRLLYYFWSEHCGMCKSMTPIIHELAHERNDIIEVDIGNDMKLARQFNIRATPTLVLVENGKVEKMLLGAKSRKKILSLLQ